jgi:hypothetical protein
MNRVELLMHRREIAAYIKADYVTVVLTPRKKVRTPSGAWVWEDQAPRRPQRVRLVPYKRRLTDFVVNNTAGNVERLPYVLVGDHTMEVAQDDRFQVGDEKFVVKWVDIQREVRMAAGVDYLGGDSANV